MFNRKTYLINVYEVHSLDELTSLKKISEFYIGIKDFKNLMEKSNVGFKENHDSYGAKVKLNFDENKQHPTILILDENLYREISTIAKEDSIVAKEEVIQ